MTAMVVASSGPLAWGVSIRRESGSDAWVLMVGVVGGCQVWMVCFSGRIEQALSMMSRLAGRRPRETMVRMHIRAFRPDPFSGRSGVFNQERSSGLGDVFRCLRVNVLRLSTVRSRGLRATGLRLMRSPPRGIRGLRFAEIFNTGRRGMRAVRG